jgi:nitrate reductase gamma subunit
MLSVPVRYLWRPGYQIVRSRRREPLPTHAGPVTSAQARNAPLARKPAQPAE